MKKLLPVLLALLGIMVACNSKKKDQAKAEDTSTTTTPTTTTPTATPTTTTTTPSNPANDAAPLVPATNTNTTNTGDIPQFSDPEIQKFVNDYTAFVMSYKKGISDPSKAQALAADKVKWTAKFGINAQKISTNPEELRKFRTWGEAMNREMTKMAN